VRVPKPLAKSRPFKWAGGGAIDAQSPGGETLLAARCDICALLTSSAVSVQERGHRLARLFGAAMQEASLNRAALRGEKHELCEGVEDLRPEAWRNLAAARRGVLET